MPFRLFWERDDSKKELMEAHKSVRNHLQKSYGTRNNNRYAPYQTTEKSSGFTSNSSQNPENLPDGQCASRKCERVADVSQTDENLLQARFERNRLDLST